jgi:hypothetical protein
MNSPGKTITFDAGGAIPKHRIVKIGTADMAALAAAAATDLIIGVSTDVDADSGDRVDVVTSGVATVEYGGNVTRGTLVTADADGKAVAAAPSAGANNRVVGIALLSGVDGDYGSVLIVPHQIQGA